MTWNYRIVRTKDESGADWFAVHEVHYDAEGEPLGMTEKPVTVEGETPEDIIGDLELMLKDARDRPVFDPPESWK